jgi:nicotinate phosphoribosyltransferase
VIGLLDEDGPDGAEPLLAPVMSQGKRRADDGWPEARARFDAELRSLPASLRTLDPARYPVETSVALTKLSHDVSARIRARELG